MFRQYLSFPPSLSRQLKSNFTYLFWDIAWWSLFTGSTSTFMNIYASHCGATSFQIGLLTAVPCLLALLVSLPLGRWLKRYPAQPVAYISAFAMRILYLLFPLMPWLFPASGQYTAILVISTVVALPATVLNISFSQFFIEAVPLEWRGLVVGGRTAIGSIISLITTLICGQLLAHVAFPLNYQIVFFMGFVGAIMTVYQIYHVHPVEDPNTPLPSLEELAPQVSTSYPAQKVAFFPAINKQTRYYLRVIVLLFAVTLIVNMVNPLIPNLLVNRLKFSDELISFASSTATLICLLTSLFMARITRRTGNRRGTTLGMIALSSQTLALALAHNSAIYMTSAVMGGIASGILNVAQTNYYYESIPSTDRPSWISINVMIGNLATLMGALVGPWIATYVGTPSALMIFGALEITIGVLIFKWG